MTEKNAAQTGTRPEQSGNGTLGNLKNSMAEGDAPKKDSTAKDNSRNSPASKGENAAAGTHASPKKRRKVNHGKQTTSPCIRTRIMAADPHTPLPFRGYELYDANPVATLLACVYCRRSHMTCDSERPCTRCIKRNIGHLCHDEPREPSKRARSEHEHSVGDDESVQNNDFSNVLQGMTGNVDVQDAAGQQILPNGIPSSSVQHGNLPSSSGQAPGATSQPVLGYNDWLGGQSQFQDMHTFHPSYMFNAPEVTNEYNLLGDFLSNSLLDDGSMFQNDDLQGIYSDPTLIGSMATLGGGPNAALLQQSQPPPLTQTQPSQGESIQGPISGAVNDKARETYYMTAADPSGSDPPEERMNKLLKAKYDAGLLRPFNYVKGYARLNQYMEKNLQQASRQKILRQLDKFRPKFRERMQSLTDIELILVEMWFERSLMEYDRVFASMAIPACCWRRTGEIFRGNKEMAELIGVPIETLRDGKLAIHEIIVEDQLTANFEGMATTSSNSEAEAETVLELAKELLQHLQNDTHEGVISVSDAFHSLDEHLGRLPLPSAPPIAIRRQLAAHGARLWNISAQMVSILGNITHLSAIALFMLDCAAPSHGSENGFIELSQKIIEVVAVRLDRLERPMESADKAQIVSATAGYYMARVHLAWLQGRPDIADHLFSKIPAIATAYGQKRVLDLCYKIGSFALNDRHYDNAAKWSERALSAWELYNRNMAQCIGNDGLSILHASIRANLQLQDSLAKERLQKALKLIEKRWPHEFAVKALQLEILSKEGHCNGSVYLQSGLIESRTSFYVQGLQQLLVGKLAASDQQEWTERIFILLVWTLTNSRLPIQNSIGILCDTMKRVAKCGRGLLSEDVTNACLILIWKYIDVVSSEGNLHVAEHWCSFVLEEAMFQLSSENKTIFIRLYFFKKIIFVLRTTASPYLEAAAARAVLPRYIHTFFQLSLDAQEYYLAESAIDQALDLACDLCGTVLRYPSDEIQWMATVAFNRAVDLYILSESDDCRRWAEKAIKLADLGEKDCAMLGDLLRERLQKLS
ncbi:hypothetical protein G4B84_005439 [Aspergillus flavus NRRL3357]|nr:uncharacterized protein G4B84_005439 [Aspergillus flavus NRRL3357]QMW30104.1 hypothetical protein G4B84_005439 [Aspergillus flavus NRRL3357]